MSSYISEVKLEEVKGWALEDEECFKHPLWFPVIISQQGMCIKPFLRISESSAEVRKHCFMVAQFPWLPFSWSLGEGAEKTNYCLHKSRARNSSSLLEATVYFFPQCHILFCIL